MKTETYRQLTRVHLLHRIWDNELELALQEIIFWEGLLDTLSEVKDPDQANAQTWLAEIAQLQQFRRAIKQLLDDIHTVDHQTAMGIRFNQDLDSDTQLDHDDLRQAMDRFHGDFRPFRNAMRQYVVTQTTF